MNAFICELINSFFYQKLWLACINHFKYHISLYKKHLQIFTSSLCKEYVKISI